MPGSTQERHNLQTESPQWACTCRRPLLKMMFPTSPYFRAGKSPSFGSALPYIRGKPCPKFKSLSLHLLIRIFSFLGILKGEVVYLHKSGISNGESTLYSFNFMDCSGIFTRLPLPNWGVKPCISIPWHLQTKNAFKSNEPRKGKKTGSHTFPWNPGCFKRDPYNGLLQSPP